MLRTKMTFVNIIAALETLGCRCRPNDDLMAAFLVDFIGAERPDEVVTISIRKDILVLTLAIPLDKPNQSSANLLADAVKGIGYETKLSGLSTEEGDLLKVELSRSTLGIVDIPPLPVTQDDVFEKGISQQEMRDLYSLLEKASEASINAAGLLNSVAANQTKLQETFAQAVISNEKTLNEISAIRDEIVKHKTVKEENTMPIKDTSSPNGASKAPEVEPKELSAPTPEETLAEEAQAIVNKAAELRNNLLGLAPVKSTSLMTKVGVGVVAAAVVAGVGYYAYGKFKGA